MQQNAPIEEDFYLINLPRDGDVMDEERAASLWFPCISAFKAG